MEITITLDADRAEQLREQASARGQSPEEAARGFVNEALAKRADEERWAPMNDRRYALIDKGRRATLTEEERAELDRLQAALDARLEGVDLQRIAQAESVLARMKERRNVAGS